MPFSHEAPFDAIHNRLPYAPFIDRRPIVWPDGGRVAVWVVPNIEHYEFMPPLGVIDPYPRTPHPDVRRYAYHDYGNRVGFWRMLRVLDKFDVPCTASLNAAVLDIYPEVAQAMVERNWDFMSHGFTNTRFLGEADEATERQMYVACNEVLYRHTGCHFNGMLGPYITASPRTPDLMAEAGMLYHADWVHDERPSPLRTESGTPLVALPYSYDLNDAPLLMRSHNEAESYANLCMAHFDRLYAEGGGRMMCLPLHPFTIGQPHRIGALNRVLDHMRSRSGVWIATASAIVDHYIAQHYDEDLALASRLAP